MALAGSKWHGKGANDVVKVFLVKVGQSATLLVGEFSKIFLHCPGLSGPFAMICLG